jgi:hypothetical protein
LLLQQPDSFLFGLSSLSSIAAQLSLNLWSF